MSRFSRREFNSLAVCSSMSAVLAGLVRTGDALAAGSIRARAFAHPGMLHSAQDLARLRAAVTQRQQPIYAGFEALRDDPHSQLTYRPLGGFEEVGRNPTVHVNEFDSDANAAYQCALMGHFTGDEAYFQLCAKILDAWSAVLKRITGADAVLCAGLGGFKLANAAELLRYGQTGWPADAAARFGQMLQDVFVPVLGGFAPFANGNWDTAAMKTLMAIAIYRDDRELFERVLVYYMHGCGDGRLEHYIYSNGQCQESGRDQQHTQLGLAHLGDCCEMAWHQGLDLYGMQENRLLLGFEYTAKYSLGEDVPFTPDLDQTGKYRHRVISPRGSLRPVYEQIYNHYVNRRGLPAPWTERAAAKIRPERAGFGADHTGFGTVLYTRKPGSARNESIAIACPAGLFLTTDQRASVRAEWIPLAAPAVYAVLRTTGKAERLTRAAGKSSDLTDTTAKAGDVYSYQVSTKDHPRVSGARTIVAALPKGWTTTAVSSDPLLGAAAFDGSVWRVAVDAVQGPAPAQRFFAVSSSMEGMITARLQPMFASQSLHAGVACFDAADPNGAAAFLLLAPSGAGDRERGEWAFRFYVQRANSTEVSNITELKLAAPQVQYGRVMRPCWFRLALSGERIQAACSTDGSTWATLSNTELQFAGSARAALVANSGMPELSTEVLFDNVHLSGRQ